MTNNIKDTPSAMKLREEILVMVRPMLVNAEAFAEDLKDRPHRKFFSEMAVIYICRSDDPDSDLTLHIGDWIKSVSGITEEELYQAAVRNTADRWTVLDLDDLWLSGGEKGRIAVLANKDFKPLGAAAILQKEALGQMSALLGGDFYAIPSSIHEFLCVRADSNVDPAVLKIMANTVNHSGMEGVISEHEILGEEPLFFDSKDGVLKEVGA